MWSLAGLGPQPRAPTAPTAMERNMCANALVNRTKEGRRQLHACRSEIGMFDYSLIDKGSDAESEADQILMASQPTSRTWTPIRPPVELKRIPERKPAGERGLPSLGYHFVLFVLIVFFRAI